MKKHITWPVWTLCLLLLLPIGALAARVKAVAPPVAAPEATVRYDEDGLYIIYDQESGTATIGGEGPLTTAFIKAHEIAEMKTLVIEEGITSIPRSAFAGYPNLEEVTLASTVGNIEENAFYGCSVLKKVLVWNRSCDYDTPVFGKTEAVLYGYVDSTTQRQAGLEGLGFVDITHPDSPPQYVYPDAVQFCQESLQLESIVRYANMTDFIPVVFSPWGTYSEFTVDSSNDAIVRVGSVFHSGIDVSYLQAGEATLTVTTKNGLTAQLNITVEAEMETLTPGQIVEVPALHGDVKLFSFTAPETCEFTLYDVDYSADTYDPNNNMSLEIWTYDSPPTVMGDNMRPCEQDVKALEKGTTYLVAVSTGETPVRITVEKTAPLEGFTIFCAACEEGEMAFSHTPFYGGRPDDEYGYGWYWYSEELFPYSGGLQRIHIIPQPLSAQAVDVYEVTWSIDEEIAFLSPDLLTNSRQFVYYRSPGTTTITATFGEMSASCTVTVEEPEKLEVGAAQNVQVKDGYSDYYTFVPQESGSYMWYMEKNGENANLNANIYVVGRGKFAPLYSGMLETEHYSGWEWQLEAGTVYYFRMDDQLDGDGGSTYTVNMRFDKTPALESVTIDNKSVTMLTGHAERILLKITPELATLDSITVSSGNEDTVRTILTQRAIYLSGCTPGTATVTVARDGKTIATVEVTVLEERYQFDEGSDIFWDEGDLVLRANGELENFQGLYIDGQLVDPANYTTAKGSTVITLKESYLRTLTSDTHSVLAAFTDGGAIAYVTCSTDGQTQPSQPSPSEPAPSQPDNPSTGDTLWPVCLALALSAGCLTVVCARRRKTL